mmetsp:Transcript_21055/g.39448  ORF Transcript_21055/g.39448 Transcript_21055/m.39448 type:complete len:288 (+) Transcript_21055:1534-2397(+)
MAVVAQLHALLGGEVPGGGGLVANCLAVGASGALGGAKLLTVSVDGANFAIVRSPNLGSFEGDADVDLSVVEFPFTASLAVLGRVVAGGNEGVGNLAVGALFAELALGRGVLVGRADLAAVLLEELLHEEPVVVQGFSGRAGDSVLPHDLHVGWHDLDGVLVCLAVRFSRRRGLLVHACDEIAGVDIDEEGLPLPLAHSLLEHVDGPSPDDTISAHCASLGDFNLHAGARALPLEGERVVPVEDALVDEASLAVLNNAKVVLVREPLGFLLPPGLDHVNSYLQVVRA